MEEQAALQARQHGNKTRSSKAWNRLCLNKAASEEIIWHCKWALEIVDKN